MFHDFFQKSTVNIDNRKINKCEDKALAQARTKAGYYISGLLYTEQHGVYVLLHFQS